MRTVWWWVERLGFRGSRKSEAHYFRKGDLSRTLCGIAIPAGKDLWTGRGQSTCKRCAQAKARKHHD